jgi:hypothetical protein
LPPCRGQKEAVLVSNRAIYNNELFEVELGNEAESTFSGGGGGSVRRKKTTPGAIRIGVTGHRPADLWHNFPLTMKKMNSVTWMMSGPDYLENGEVVTTFTKHNLKELQFGDKVGVMRCPEFEGALVFYINQEVVGIMATSVPDKVFAFVEMHENCEKITITPVHSVSQENLPVQIREVREKESEMRRHKKTIQEKEEVIQVLEKRIDELNTQISTMQATSKPGKGKSLGSPPAQVNGQSEPAAQVGTICGNPSTPPAHSNTTRNSTVELLSRGTLEKSTP